MRALSFLLGVGSLCLVLGCADKYAGRIEVTGKVTLKNAPLDDGIIDLGTLPGGSYSSPTAINESGQVVGWSATSGCCVHQPFSWTAEDGMVEIGNLGNNGGAAIDVNENGQVVGNSPVANGTMHAFAWTAAAIIRSDTR